MGAVAPRPAIARMGIERMRMGSGQARAGGLGIFETLSAETDACKAEIDVMVGLGLPLGVNLPIRFRKYDAMLKFVCECGVNFVTTCFRKASIAGAGRVERPCSRCR